MQGSLTLSIALGIGLAGINVALSIAYAKKAIRAPSARFVGTIFKGMGLRMAGVLGTLILVFLFIPVDAISLAASFLTVALIGLVVEVRMLSRLTRTTGEGNGVSS